MLRLLFTPVSLYTNGPSFPLYLSSADESGGATETVTRAIDEQENKFDDFIQNILKSSATGGGAGEEGGAAGDALRAQQSGPPALSLAEKLSALSTVRSRGLYRLVPC